MFSSLFLFCRYFATHLQNYYTAPFVTVQNITELAFLVTILVTTDSSIRSGWALFPTLFFESNLAMPKQISPMPLVLFRQLKSPGFYALGGAKGLYLRIRGNSEDFVVRYQDTSGSRHTISIGFRRSMSLSEARAKANEIHGQLSEGVNPALNKKAVRRRVNGARPQTTNSEIFRPFSEVTDSWINYRIANKYWQNDQKEPYATSNLLARHVLPQLGNIDINKITIENIRDVLVPIWTTKTVTAKKALRNIRAILNWAHAMKYRQSSEDLCSLQGPLGVLMEGARKNAVRKENFAALPFSRIPAFMFELWHLEGGSNWMMMFAILTACRMKAARLATWSEIDFENGVWEVPPDHDKVKAPKRDRTIYLSEQALEVLRRVQPSKPSPKSLIFRNDKGKEFSDAATSALIRRMHQKQLALDKTGWIDPAKSKREGKPCIITAHETARSGFRTWSKDDQLGNNRKYDQEAAELCLFHNKTSDEFNGAYDRSALATERRLLMNDWGKFCFSLISPL